MAANDELIRLILSVSGDDAIAALSDRLDENRASVQALQAEFTAGEVTVDAYLKAMGRLANEGKSLQGILDQLAAATIQQADATEEAVVSLDDLSDELALAEQAERDAAQAAYEAAAAYQILGAETYDLAAATDTASEKNSEYAVSEYNNKQAADAAAAAYRAEQADLSGLSDGVKLTKKDLDQLAATKAATSTATGALKASIKALEAELVDLKAQARAGSISLEEFSDKHDKLAKTINSQKGMLNSLGGEASLSASKFLNLGNTLDDLQYVGEMGLRPIINNVMQIAPAVGIAMIAVEMLRKAFGEQVVDAFNKYVVGAEKAATTTETLKKKIEDLEKKPGKVALDLADLEQAKHDLDQIEKRKAALDSARGSAPEAALAALAKSTVTDYGGGTDVVQGTVEAMDRASGVKRGSEADRARLAELTKSRDFRRTDESDADYALRKKQTQTAIDDVMVRINEAYRAYAESETADFIKGDPGAIARMRNRATSNPGAFARQGLDGVSFGESIANLPANVSEMRRRQMVDESIGSTDELAGAQDQAWKRTKAAKAAAAKAQKAAIQKSIQDTEREDTDLDKFVDVAIPAAAKQAEAGAEKRRRKQEEAMGFIARQRQGERAKAQAAALDPGQAAINGLTPQAAAHLNQNGFNRDEAAAYAPKLADALLRGADLNLATQELAMQMLSAINDANMRTMRAEAMLRFNQNAVMRQRQVRPTLQNLPLN